MKLTYLKPAFLNLQLQNKGPNWTLSDVYFAHKMNGHVNNNSATVALNRFAEFNFVT